MAEESAKLRIPYIAAAQAQKHVTHNEAMTLLDTLVQLSVLDKDLTAPPAEPQEGDTYIVAESATGAWEGWDNRVTRFIDGEWRSYLPGQGGGAGWLAWVLDEDAMYRFDGAAWDPAGIEGPEGPSGPAGADGQSFQPDAVAALIAGRDAYDDEPAAFSVLVVSDAGNGGKPTLYFKLSAGSADWSDGITWAAEGGGGVARGHIFGLTLSNNATDATNDIDVAAGQAADDDGAAVMVLPSGMTKRLDAAWAVGTGNGGLDTGSIANTTYHVWLIRRSDTGVVDALFSLSATSPAMPANYDQKRRIGSILRAAGSVVAFVQDGDYFRRSASTLGVNANNPGTDAVTATLVGVPTGIRVFAIVNVRVISTSTPALAYVSDLDATDEAPSQTAAPLATANGNSSQSGALQMEIRTDTSAQIRYRLSASDSNTQFRIATLGWKDKRGRDG